MSMVRMKRARHGGLSLLLLALLMSRAAADPLARDARDYLASIRPSSELQAFLDRTVDALEASDPKLRQTDVRIALLDMSHGDSPLLAERHGTIPIYPASVVKFVYLMAAYAWTRGGRGRDGSCEPPPAQIPASATNALGSCLR